MIADNKCSAVIRPFHCKATGERAKCRQQADACAKLEARQAQTLAALAAQAIHRMHMPSQHVVAGVGVRFVLQGERTHQQRLGDHLHSQVGWRVAGAFVVIATNQRQAHTRMAHAPCPQRLQRATGVGSGAVQEIAKKDYLHAR